MILAGHFTQVAISKIIFQLEIYLTINLYLVCGLLIGVSAVAALLTTLKSKGKKLVKGLLTLVGSLIINLGGKYLGLNSIWIFLQATNYDDDSYVTDKYMGLREFTLEYYFYATTPVMAIASLVITVHFLKKRNPQESKENTKLPDPEIILLGICVQYLTVDIIALEESILFCQRNGLGYWLVVLVVSGISTILTFVKTPNPFRLTRSFFTLVGSFITLLSAVPIGSLSIACFNIP